MFCNMINLKQGGWNNERGLIISDILKTGSQLWEEIISIIRVPGSEKTLEFKNLKETSTLHLVCVL